MSAEMEGFEKGNMEVPITPDNNPPRGILRLRKERKKLKRLQLTPADPIGSGESSAAAPSASKMYKASKKLKTAEAAQTRAAHRQLRMVRFIVAIASMRRGIIIFSLCKQYGTILGRMSSLNRDVAEAQQEMWRVLRQHPVRSPYYCFVMVSLNVNFRPL